MADPPDKPALEASATETSKLLADKDKDAYVAMFRPTVFLDC